MKVYNNDEVISNVSIDFSGVISSNKIWSDDGVMLQYKNSIFLASIKELVDDVVINLGITWRPDYKNSRTYFYISESEISLFVEVLPRHYSAIEKQTMLETAETKEKDDGLSDYLKLLNMFDDIDEVLNCACPTGEAWEYSLELIPEETKKLLSLIK